VLGSRGERGSLRRGNLERFPAGFGRVVGASAQPRLLGGQADGEVVALG
jgi:hypothetical protein